MYEKKKRGKIWLERKYFVTLPPPTMLLAGGCNAEAESLTTI